MYEQILASIEQQMPGTVLSSDTALDGILNLNTSREKVHSLLQFLRDDAQLQFNFLTSLCGVHYPDRTGQELGLVYHLHSWTNNTRLRIKISFPSDEPNVPTATNLWPTANWMERQEYDFFGINFVGHPDLRRILNVDDLGVFPMRKEYKLEDGTRTDKDDRFFGRDGHVGQTFETNLID
ncbi:MAG: NADH-quinone oxidoreductase subunit C [Saprospiraceae bacterium]|nr:NADH-quinone oxidoreductase subunit C [Saprospiraceae bacterium]